MIAGASDAISKITAILIPDEAINIDGISENQQQTIDITQYLPDGIRLADETDALIAVSVEIEKKQGKTVTIPVSRIGVQNVPTGMEVDFGDTSSIELVVMGTSSELAALDTEAIAVTLDVGHTRAGTYTGTLNVTLPDSSYSLMQDVEIQYKLVKRTAADDNKTTGDSSSTTGSTDGKKDNASDAGNDNTTGNSTPDNTAGGNSSGDSAGESKNDSATE